MPPHPPTLGVILAGGAARRMGGGDKPLVKLEGRTLLEHVIGRLAPQCDGLILNANGDPSRFDGTGLPVAPDSIPGHPGPLAGILAALEWAAAERPDILWVVSAPGDTPFLPLDLVARLQEAREAARLPLARASTGSRAHHAAGLWPVHLRHELYRDIAADGIRRVKDWTSRHGIAEAVWASEPFDPFFNINTPDDLAQARNLAERHAAHACDVRPARNDGRKSPR